MQYYDIALASRGSSFNTFQISNKSGFSEATSSISHTIWTQPSLLLLYSWPISRSLSLARTTLSTLHEARLSEISRLQSVDRLGQKVVDLFYRKCEEKSKY